MLKGRLAFDVRIVAVILTTVAILWPSVGAERSRAASPPGPYALTDLGTLGGLSAQALDVNDLGQVVGYATTAASQARGYIWRNGAMTDLGTLAGTSSVAYGINAQGAAVGRSTIGTNSTTHAVLWENGTKIDLTPGAVSGTSAANAINNARQIVGTAGNGSGFLWEDGVLTVLGHLGGGAAYAADINENGQIVGSSNTNIVINELGPLVHAFVWNEGVMTDLGMLPGDEESGAAAINNLGQIVGSSSVTDPLTYATTSRSILYENGVMVALAVPSSESYASDINDAGMVVGTMRTGVFHSNFDAYIYADGVATNLNTLVPSGSGLHLVTATGINSAGQIVGWAVDSRNAYHAFLLTPIVAGTPAINVADNSVIEGNSGAHELRFTVALGASATQAVTVSYSTANATATAPGDYAATSGLLTFEPGQTTRTVSVQVNGDRIGEPDEVILLNLSQPSGATIGDGQGRGTITDDEPRASVGDVAKNEGNSSTTQFVFTVGLSAPSTAATSVNFATADGSAKAGEDYDARTGTVTFNAGETTKTIAITVRGDRKSELNEVFWVNLSGGAGVFLGDWSGSGTIRNDDR